jgi:hypothetical protein
MLQEENEIQECVEADGKTSFHAGEVNNLLRKKPGD